MLQSQLTKGNNGLVKKKYITFGIEADSLRTAKPKLERIETDILNNFKTLGVKTEPLSGYERLKVLHDVFNMDTNEDVYKRQEYRLLSNDLQKLSYHIGRRTGAEREQLRSEYNEKRKLMLKMPCTAPVSYTHDNRLIDTYNQSPVCQRLQILSSV